MSLRSLTARFAALFLSAVILWVPARVQAEMLDTRQALQSILKKSSDREQLVSLVQRKDVLARFQELGVSRTEALNRVNTMTDDEVARVMTQIEQYAGGDPLWRDSGAKDPGYIFTLVVALLVIGCLAFCWLFFI